MQIPPVTAHTEGRRHPCSPVAQSHSVQCWSPGADPDSGCAQPPQGHTLLPGFAAPERPAYQSHSIHWHLMSHQSVWDSRELRLSNAGRDLCQSLAECLQNMSTNLRAKSLAECLQNMSTNLHTQARPLGNFMMC